MSRSFDIEQPNRQNGQFLNSIVAAGVMMFVILTAAYLRFVGIDWDENQHLHPDERFLTMVTTNISPAKSVTDYFDTLSTRLNPNNVGFGFFVYGDFPVIAARYIGEAIGQTSYFDVYLVGRALSAVADMIVLGLIFLIGRQLFDWRVGLLGSALYGAAALPIQLSHFYTVDTLTNLFVTASFYFVARALNKHRWLDYVLFGVTLGLAVASKINVAPLALILILALWLRSAREQLETPDQTVDEQTQLAATPALIGPSVRALIGLVIAGVVTIVTFRVSQPYAFLPPSSGLPIDDAALGPVMDIITRVSDPIGMRLNPAWVSQMEEVRQQVSGYSDIPPNHQWGQRLPLIFPWINMVQVGMGWLLGLICWLGFAWALWEIARRHARADRLLLLVAWTGLYFGWQGIAWVKTLRYFLPVYPFLTLLGAWALITLRDRIQVLILARRASRWHPAMLTTLAIGAVVIAGTYLWGFAVSRIYTRPVTRVAASHWIFENVPSDLSLFVDTIDGEKRYEFGLPNTFPPAPVSPSSDDQIHPAVAHSRILPGPSQPFEFKPPASGKLSRLRVNHLLDPLDGSTTRSLSISVWRDPFGKEKLSGGVVSGNFPATGDPRGASYDVALDPVDVVAGQSIYITLETDALGPLDISSATVTTEGDWDDPLPLPVEPYNIWGAQYQAYALQMAWEDIPEKRQRIEYILDNTDYLFISSNRFYASMSRNPNRFPLTVAYYQALFGGNLGFDLVADFTSRPNLGPFEFNDDNAEEAWTVYDHPRVFVFKKSSRYTAQSAAAILDNVDLAHTEKVIAKDAVGAPVVIPMPVLKTTSVKETPGPVVTETPPGASLSEFYRNFQSLTVIIWWLAVSLIGWLAFPILYTTLPALDDRAYPLARAFGLLLAAWLAWMLASLHIAAWGWVAGAVAFALVFLLSAILVSRNRDEFKAWLRDNRRHIVFVELLSLILFGFFVLVRLGNPDLWHPQFGGEKPMDMAYLNAVLKSEFFPPYDPWFTGGTINYYYFGFVIVGLPIKLLGIPTTIAYNLALPTIFSMTGVGAFSVAYNMVATPSNSAPRPDLLTANSQSPGLWATLKRWPQVSLGELTAAFSSSIFAQDDSSSSAWQPYLAGVAALLLAVVLGNLDQIRTLAFGLAEAGSGETRWANTLLPPLNDVADGIKAVIVDGKLLPVGLGEWYWNATRLIPVPINEAGNPTEVGPITEFPYFTFLYADLHAHMIAMPITLLSLAWCVAQIRAAGQANADNRRSSVGSAIGALLIGGLCIGALRPTNTWDWPTYLSLGSAALMLAHFYRRGDQRSLSALLAAALGAALSGGVAYAFFGTPDYGDPTTTSFTIPVTFAFALIGLLIGYGIGLSLVKNRAVDETSAQEVFHLWVTLLGGLAQAGILAGLTVLLFLPFVLTYQLGYTSFIPWQGSTTPVWAYLDMLGLFLFIIVSWMIVETWGWARATLEQHPFKRAYWLPLASMIVLFALVIAALLSSNYPISGVVAPLALWAAFLLLRSALAIEKRAALAMLIFALALSMIVEVSVLQGDISRMNTVFKFYLQVWLLMAVTGGAALGWLWPFISRLSELPRTAWSGALAVLVFLAILYPLLGTRAKIEDRWSLDAPQTLDGIAFMPHVERFENGKAFPLAPDYDALRWLQDNIAGTPVILEAHTVEYNWGNRVTVYTGLPAIVGWNWHQRQQRSAQSDEVWARVNDVDTLYNTVDLNLTRELLSKYDVRLIIVGELERAYYDPAGLAKFEDMANSGALKILYNHYNTLIYQVAETQQ